MVETVYHEQRQKPILAAFLPERMKSYFLMFPVLSSRPLSLAQGSTSDNPVISDMQMTGLSEVIDISAGNLDFNLCFIQSSISHDVHCIEVE